MPGPLNPQPRGTSALTPADKIREELRKSLRDRYFPGGFNDLAESKAMGDVRSKLGAPASGSASVGGTIEESKFEARPPGASAPVQASPVPAAAPATTPTRASPVVAPKEEKPVPTMATLEAIQIERIADKFGQRVFLELSRQARAERPCIDLLRSLEALVLLFAVKGPQESDQVLRSAQEDLQRASHDCIRSISLRYYESLIELRQKRVPLNATAWQELVSGLVDALNRELYAGRRVVFAEGEVLELDDQKHSVIGARAPGASPRYRPMSFGVSVDGRLAEQVLVCALASDAGGRA